MKQMNLFKKRGGKRRGAGRKKVHPDLLPHTKRPDISKNYPMHITIKLKEGVKTLRKKSCYEIFRESITKAADFGLNVVHYSVQKNHIHLIIEAKNRETLSKGMKSLTIRLAKGINKIHGTIGKIFKDRYHLHVLYTPTEVKRALIYVFKNTAKAIKSKNLFDPFSTIINFRECHILFKEELIDYSCFPEDKLSWFKKELQRILSPPDSFLLSVGWKRLK